MLLKLKDKLHDISSIWFFIAASLIWIIIISYLHYKLNVEQDNRRIVLMGYMPVVTNMAAPLLDYASQNDKDVRFKALKYSSFAEMAESLRNHEIDVGFMIAPLSVVLKQQGEPVRVVYIGNRHESTFVTRKSLNIKRLEDLIGKTVAVPMRYSGHNLSITKLIDEKGLTGSIKVVEMNPPDMASALVAGQLDGYYVGEPFAAKTLVSGDSSLFFHVEDVWPNFMCNLMVVRQDFIDNEPGVVKKLVQSAIRSGLWANKNKDKAAAIASKYWNQSEDLVKYAINTPENRILFNKYIPVESEFQYMAGLMKKYGLVNTDDISGLVYDEYAKNADLSNIEEITDIVH